MITTFAAKQKSTDENETYISEKLATRMGKVLNGELLAVLATVGNTMSRGFVSAEMDCLGAVPVALASAGLGFKYVKEAVNGAKIKEKERDARIALFMKSYQIKSIYSTSTYTRYTTIHIYFTYSQRNKGIFEPPFFFFFFFAFSVSNTGTTRTSDSKSRLFFFFDFCISSFSNALMIFLHFLLPLKHSHEKAFIESPFEWVYANDFCSICFAQHLRESSSRPFR